MLFKLRTRENFTLKHFFQMKPMEGREFTEAFHTPLVAQLISDRIANIYSKF